MPEKPPSYAGSAEVSELFGVTERRVQQLAKEGTISSKMHNRTYKFNLLEVAGEYIKYLSDTREEPMDGSSQAKKLNAEIRMKEAKAKMIEIQVKELEGKMHRYEDVEEMTIDLVLTIRGLLCALPGRLAKEVLYIEDPAEAAEKIKIETNQVLTELSKYQYNPEAYAEKVREREGWKVLAEDEEEEE